MLKSAFYKRFAERRAHRRVSLGFVLAATLIGTQIISICLIIGFAYLNSERAIKSLAVNTLMSRSRAPVTDVEEAMLTAENAAILMERLIENDAFDVNDFLAIERNLFELLSTSPELSRASFALPNGTSVIVSTSASSEIFISWISQADNDNVAVTYRDGLFRPQGRFLQNVFLSKPAPIMPPSFDPRDPGQMRWWHDKTSLIEPLGSLAVISPVLRDGTLVGVVGVELSLSEIGRILRDSNPGQDQFVTILSGTGEIIIQADRRGYSDGSSIAADDDMIIRTAVERFNETGDPVVIDLDIAEADRGTGRYLAFLGRLGQADLGWLFSMHVSRDNLTNGLQQRQRSLLWIAALGLLLMSPLSIIMARRIRSPLVAFADRTGRVAKGEVLDADVIDAPFSELEDTGRILAEEMSQRRNFQSAYERTFDVSSRGMARMHPRSLAFLHVNDRLTQMLGQQRARLEKTSLWQLLGHAYRDDLKQFVSALLEDREFSFDFQISNKESDDFWIRASALMIRDHDGAPNHALVVFDDVDDARRASDQLKELKHELHFVGRVNTMGQFAAGLAHELNQPLGALMHDIDSVQFLIANLDTPNKHEIEATLSDIMGHAERSGDIIRALRDLIQKDRSGAASFLLLDLLEQTRTLVEPEAKLYNAQVHIHVDPDLQVFGNRSQVAQVFVNLIRNSFEASVRDPQEACQLVIKAAAHDETVVIEVEDNGPGMPANTLPFVPFSSTRPGGMGLGLSICKSLIEANEGKITYNAIDPRGSRFVIELPIKQNP